MGGGGIRTVEVVTSKGCTSILFHGSGAGDASLKKKIHQSNELFMSPASEQSGPFSGLVICVTGLSEDTRKQVKDATEKLGGVYSPNLHPRCTHLVVQISVGLKLEHVVKHGSSNGLYLVTIGWLVDSSRRKERLSEDLYRIRLAKNNDEQKNGKERVTGLTSPYNSCSPVSLNDIAKQSTKIEEEAIQRQSSNSLLSQKSIYIDLDISPDLQAKVIEAACGEGAKFTKKWHPGCDVNYVVCEGSSALRYMGQCSNLVTPAWILGTAAKKTNKLQKLFHMSTDLARQVQAMLQHDQNGALRYIM